MKHYKLDARRVIALREEQGLTQAALAKRIGISRPAMCMFENGQAQPSAVTARAIAKALGVGFSEIASQAAGPAEPEEAAS